MRVSISLLFVLLLMPVCSQATEAGTRDYAVEVSAIVHESPPRIDLSWPADPTAPEYFIFRKAEGDAAWSAPIAHLDSSATSFTDSDVIVGQGYEYAFRKTLGSFSDTVQVPNDTGVTFTIYDLWQDGMCCYHGLGAYEVVGCEIVYAEGGCFGAEEATSFTFGSLEEPCNELIINIVLDVYGQETTWQLTENASGGVLAEGGPYATPHFSHIFAGIKYPAIEDRGTVLLLVEELLVEPLADEIRRLEMDLIADGYRVCHRVVNRNDEVTAVKGLILAEQAGDPSIETLFLLGRIPVPYSGNVLEHSDHCGAWPADTYYGELDGTWTDVSVNNTSASRPENHNIPGDGKFDQTFLPSDMDLQVGRVDLANMPVFAEGELALMARYLDKNHIFRTGRATADRRGLIDDNVGDLYGLAPAATGWRYFTGIFGAGLTFAGDFFPTLESESYLWCYGCGAGSYTSCSGVGTSYDFATRTVNSVFTSLYGSYFGDWDSTNNILRAVLGAQGQPLVCIYSGRPNWHFHYMALGYSMGHSTRLTQNNIYQYTSSDCIRQVPIALMGDPTLKLHTFAAPSQLQATLLPNEHVELAWTSAGSGMEGYHIYRALSVDAQFERINSAPVEDLTWIDTSPLDGNNVYMVRAIKLEITGSGTYYNLSSGVFDSLMVSSSVEEEPHGIHKITNLPNPFAAGTIVHFLLPKASRGLVQVFNVTGGLVRTLFDGELAAGEQNIDWDGINETGRSLPSGLYFCTLTIDGHTHSRRMILLK